MIIIRYADDSVLGFEFEQEAKRFLQDLQERLQAFHGKFVLSHKPFARKSLLVNSGHLFAVAV